MGNCHNKNEAESAFSAHNNSPPGSPKNINKFAKGKYIPELFEDNDNKAFKPADDVIRLHEGSILHVDTHNQWLGTCSDDQTIAISDINSIINWKKYSPVLIKDHQKAVNKVVFSSENNNLNLWSASRDLTIKLASFF
jgi:hypothetical protein